MTRTAPTSDPKAAAADPRAVAFARLLAIVDRLREPDGCPWDRKQTVQSMAPHLVEEAHEALEAVETGSDAQIAEEAGDILMVVALVCRIGEESGRFDLARAADAVGDKLVRRHPHVFGDVQADSAEEVLVNWEAIKKAEREGKKEDASALAGVPVALPALQRAQRVCGKAMSAGFRWEGVEGAVAKLREEQGELEEALEASGLGRGAKHDVSPALRARVEHELGDVMLAAADLAQYLEMDAERVAREAVRRFEQRFRSMESAIGRPMKECTLDEMLAAWKRAKGD
jgi:MazG family protein